MKSRMGERDPFQRATTNRSAAKRLAVLAICDAPVVRQLVASTFAKEVGVSLTTAVDWRHAERKIRAAKTDVALLCSDRLWPDDPGARAIHALGIPLLVGSVETRAQNLQAVLLGLVARVREEARAKRPSGSRSVPGRSAHPAPGQDVPTTSPLVAIGASAGGTMAIKSILQAMPARSPAMVIVQHMSDHFTGAFAQGLARICSMEVREAENGDVLSEGRAIIAPGNRHLVVERHGTTYIVKLVEGPLVSRHRPSVNVLLRSVAQEAGQNGVGVILTGMGDDGADGLFEMKELGGQTLAQNEATSVVFGMPRAAIVRGGVGQVVPLSDIASTILKCAGYRSRSPR